MGCAQSHENNANGITADGVTRFAVVTDASFAESGIAVASKKKGIIEINDEEIVHYQNKRPPTKWSFKCLRRYGNGYDMFVFECGRRCSTGPGIFAFKCHEADSLLSVFTQKLQQYSQRRRLDSSAMRLTNGGGGTNMPVRSRYSQSVGRSNPPLPSIEEPYLIPISSYQNCGMQYVNGDMAVSKANGHAYINTNGHALNGPPIDVNKLAVDLGSNHTTPVRDLNYADLDLPKSNAIGFPEPHNHNDRKMLKKLPENIQCVDIIHWAGGSSDDDDDAFLPAPTNGTNSYINLDGAHSESNGMRPVMYSEGSVKMEKRPSESARSKALGGDDSGIQYATIDFHKTAAVASATKVTQESGPHEEGVRKTRHDSSAENLN